jgi:hypothetical protein
MRNRFLEYIQDIKENLSASANRLNQEKQRVNARQSEIDAELLSLQPRLLRAEQIKSRDDLLCPHCFIDENVEAPLSQMNPAESEDPHNDYYHCHRCDGYYEHTN